MRTERLRKRLGAMGLAAAAFGSAATPAMAQCFLCYSSAAASGSRGIRALQIGILVLLVPTLTLLAGILLYTFRRRNSDLWGSDPSWMDANGEKSWVAQPVPESADGAPSRL